MGLKGIFIALVGLASLGCTGVATAQVGAFDRGQDVGAVRLAGAASHESGRYRVTGGGANIWGEADAFQFVWTRRSGDLHVAADIAWDAARPGSDPHRKAGLMIRQNLSAGSPYADVMVHGDGLIALQYRELQDGPTRQIIAATRAPSARVRLEREGDYVYFSLPGPDGRLAHAGGNYRIRLGPEYHVGLAVSAHNDALTETATFSNVTLEVPVLAYVPDTGYPARVESTLEVMEVGGAQSRRVVRHFDGKIEAPNWSRDNQLIYNSGGRIYRIPADGGEPVVINTGPNIDNNNDHGISPDGTELVISDQSDEDNLSRIHILPITGSDAPRLVVGRSDARSYWHGWSPDGRTLAYVHVSTDNRLYDIHVRDVAGGPERPLITGEGVDDGPEYSPDGRHIYFNSTRSGAMQIWRADATDGSSPEPVTSDPSYRDWFPHLSPDGRWIVFVSFGLDVELGDHPPNRDVMLRIMPADGSAPPRILTRLFGGQGTINVPSWSPDGRQIAFVSYRLVR
jgi:Tol biopolymer transport system component